MLRSVAFVGLRRSRLVASAQPETTVFHDQARIYVEGGPGRQRCRQLPARGARAARRARRRRRRPRRRRGPRLRRLAARPRCAAVAAAPPRRARAATVRATAATGRAARIGDRGPARDRGRRPRGRALRPGRARPARGRRRAAAPGGTATSASPARPVRRRASPSAGSTGESGWIELRLRLLADAGLVGLPNAGKSSLLGRLTRAAPKVAGYPFTTLEPVLGTIDDGERQLVLADIPGLIEGAAEGAGLGHEFLAHVERCRVLVHVVEIGPLGERPADRLRDRPG